MRREEAVKELLKLAEEHGVVITLYGVFGKRVKVRVPFSMNACNASIDGLAFSPRAEHSLKRAGVFTVGGVMNLIATDDLLHIRNLGIKTQNEIKTRMLAFGYGQLNEAEKKRFFYDVIHENRL